MKSTTFLSIARPSHVLGSYTVVEPSTARTPTEANTA